LLVSELTGLVATRDENRQEREPNAAESIGQNVRTIRSHPQGLEGKKISGRSRSVFLDFPFYRTYRDVASDGHE
jgi:hypothetical protein